MAKLNVEIVTPERRLVQALADEAILPGVQGLFGVRPGHAPLVAAMDAGELLLKDGATVQRFFVHGGFVQVASDTVRVLAEGAEPLAATDVAKAKKQLAEAEARLAALPAGDARAELERKAVARAAKRVEVISRAPSA